MFFLKKKKKTFRSAGLCSVFLEARDKSIESLYEFRPVGFVAVCTHRYFQRR